LTDHSRNIVECIAASLEVTRSFVIEVVVKTRSCYNEAKSYVGHAIKNVLINRLKQIGHIIKRSCHKEVKLQRDHLKRLCHQEITL
jgi:hypothetical protein